MIIVTLREKRLLTLVRRAHPRVRRRMLKVAMQLVSDSIRAIPPGANDNAEKPQRDFLSD